MSAEVTGSLSIVIPVYNEEENLPELQRRLTAVLPGLVEDYEILYVDDGSRDRSASIIREFHDGDARVKLVRLSRNFGHQAALNAGLDQADGDAVVLMDADLQDPPEVIEELVSRWRSGADVVHAVRERRAGNPIKRASYKAFYRIYRRLADIDVPIDSGDFCLLDSRVVAAIRELPEVERFLRGLRAWVGYNQEFVPYDRPDRYAGEPKYSWSGLVRLALDGLFSFSAVPLRLASFLGFFTAAAGVVYVMAAVGARLFTGDVPQGWTSIIAIVLVVGGVQLIMIGILGEYIARIYAEAKRRPTYLVRERLG